MNQFAGKRHRLAYVAVAENNSGAFVPGYQQNLLLPMSNGLFFDADELFEVLFDTAGPSAEFMSIAPVAKPVPTKTGSLETPGSPSRQLVQGYEVVHGGIPFLSSKDCFPNLCIHDGAGCPDANRGVICRDHWDGVPAHVTWFELPEVLDAFLQVVAQQGMAWLIQDDLDQCGASIDEQETTSRLRD